MDDELKELLLDLHVKQAQLERILNVTRHQPSLKVYERICGGIITIEALLGQVNIDRLFKVDPLPVIILKVSEGVYGLFPERSYYRHYFKRNEKPIYTVYDNDPLKVEQHVIRQLAFTPFLELVGISATQHRLAGNVDTCMSDNWPYPTLCPYCTYRLNPDDDEALDAVYAYVARGETP